MGQSLIPPPELLKGSGEISVGVRKTRFDANGLQVAWHSLFKPVQIEKRASKIEKYCRGMRTDREGCGIIADRLLWFLKRPFTMQQTKLKVDPKVVAMCC